MQVNTYRKTDGCRIRLSFVRESAPPCKVSTGDGGAVARTHVTAVKGLCLDRLTNGPKNTPEVGSVVAEVGFEPTTCRV